jgi:hypothetical protein
VDDLANQLESFFDSLTAEAQLQQFVTDQREEDLHLEFKQKTDSSHANLEDGDRRGFSKTLAGFANADGGVLIFGVSTTHAADHPDRASALQSIASPDTFRAKLLDSVLNVTQPSVDGLRIEVVPAGVPGRGYVKCLVPPSDRPPHRAMHAGREYYRRTSNAHVKMEHYELEDVFGRRLRPALRIGLKLVPIDPPDGREELRFTFRNDGRGVAHHAGLVCFLGVAAGQLVATTGAISDASGINDGRPAVTYYNSQSVVHPNGLYSFLGAATLRRAAPGTPLHITVKCYAENMAARDATANLEPGPTGIVV